MLDDLKIMFDDLKKLSEDELKAKREEYIQKVEDASEILDNYHKEYLQNPDTSKYEYVLVNSKTMERASPEIIELFLSINRMQMAIGTIRGLLKQKKAEKLTKFIFKFITVDKKSNPELYPEYLTFVIENISESGVIGLLPVVNLSEFLKQSANVTELNSVFIRIKNFWSKFIREGNLAILNVKYEGFDEYAKKVFNKEIRKRIKEEVDPDNRLHSVVFKKPVNTYFHSIRLFQIVPRFKKNHNYYTSYQSKRQIQKDLKKLLREYGWIENVNYQDFLENT